VKLLPCIAKVRIGSPNWPTLWLPLFLFWPLILAALLVLLLGFTVFASVRGAGDGPRVWPIVASCYVFLCELRGTRVSVGGSDSQVFISVS
jgi:hypothetical protein